MKKFFENYGFAALIPIVVIVLIIIATPVGNSVENATTSMIGSFKNSVVTSLNYTLFPGQILKVAGKKMIVLSNQGDNKYLVMDLSRHDNIKFNSNQNGQDDNKCSVIDNKSDTSGCINTYENSTVDNYLENTVYPNLPKEIKDAIIPFEIQQSKYIKIKDSNRYKFDTNKKGWMIKDGNNWVQSDRYIPRKGLPGAHLFKFETHIGNVIERHLFVPSIAELESITDFNDEYQTSSFLSIVNNRFFLVRDANYNNILTIDYDRNSIRNTISTSSYFGVNPTFVIDLSNIEYTNLNQQFVK